MANMLSAQLAAFQLNVLNGLLDSACSILPRGSASSSTVSDLIADADAALAAAGYTPAGDPNRALQTALKDAIDAANNMNNFGPATERPAAAARRPVALRSKSRASYPS